MAKNPELFREMSVPFENPGAAGAAYEAFFSDLAELRKKHKLPNVYCIVGGSYKAEGDESEFLVTMMWGEQLRAESMTAWAYGYEQAQRQALVESLMASAKRRRSS